MIAQWEWRALTAAEQQALVVFWTSVGKDVGLTTVPRTWTDYNSWMATYTAQHMRPADTNRRMAQIILNDMIPSWVPTALHSLAHDVVYSLLDPRVRAALGFPNARVPVPTIVHGLLRLRQSSVRYVCLPRRKAR